MTDIMTPALGESVTEATVAKWSRKAGEAVKRDEVLVELETDKVSLEVVAPEDGVLSEIAAAEGATVKPGEVLGRIGAGGPSVKPAMAAAKETVAPPPLAAPASLPAAAPPMPLIPSVERIVAENHLDPTEIAAAGRNGRITKADALAALEARAARPAPPPSPTPAREVHEREERVRMSRLRQTIARRLKEAQSNAAMLTTFNEADMSAVMALRAAHRGAFEKRQGVRLGYMGFFVKACVAALRDVPEVNAEIDGADLIYKNHYDIGVAVGTERGLVVPVIRDADALSLGGIEAAIAALGGKARDGSLALDDLQGGTVTISNGGVYGSRRSTPILNAPQSGILGLHKIQDRPVAVDGQVAVRPMMYLAL
ncbi:MAG: 2-oxoglutarate dehydrogenase complex dihydrolipoyllysine-residue succinyltransferase, partial [Caulobacteraceae bacterium]